MRFPNRTGDHVDTDVILRAELEAAGIPTLQQAGGHEPDFMAAVLRQVSGEVKTSVQGLMHGWSFKRASIYWSCKGPGIELAAAERLYATYGQTVRVMGGGSPRERFHGLACGSYHVDDSDGLRALADTIRSIVVKATTEATSVA